MNPDLRKQLDPTLLGKIVLARFLELPLRRFDQFVQQLESEPVFARLSEFVTTARIPDAKMASRIDPDSMMLGEIAWSGETPELLYHRPSFIREYRFDDTALSRIPSEALNEKDLRNTLHRLRLVNTRNRLTHVVTRFMIRHQTVYLLSGNPTLLRPLTQVQISSGLSNDALYSGVADPSRISRLIRELRVVLPNGRIQCLRDLSPSYREICCHFVGCVIKSEKSLMDEGNLSRPLTDGEIGERVGINFDAWPSRRTVAFIRRELGIPEGKERRIAGVYHAATAGFSSPMPLSSSVLKESVPTEPGVYEIRSFVPGDSEGVVYIGSAGNLRKRLSHHLHGIGNNPRLRKKISGGARFRYQVFKEAWRNVERELYRTFCDTFGGPPECNRMSP